MTRRSRRLLCTLSLALTAGAVAGCSDDTGGDSGPATDGQATDGLRTDGEPSDAGAAPADQSADGDAHCPTVTDRFEQDAKRKVDVLFLVSTSSTMSGKLTKLEASGSTFERVISQQKSDYHIGVVSMSPDRSKPNGALGKLLGSPAYLDNTVKDLALELETRLELAPSTDDVLGLDALKAALLPPVATTVNKGFRRSDASLEIVAFVDNNDHSESITVSKAAALLASFASTKKHTYARLHADLSDSCCCSRGPGWRSLAWSTGGTIGDLCDTDYKGFAETVALRIFGLRDQFTLSRQPSSVASVNVTLDGKSAKGVTYHTLSNAVTFSKPPADGATIRISYEVCR